MKEANAIKNNKANYKKKEIQRAANKLFEGMISNLQAAIPEIYWKYRNEEDQDDKGIDYQHELEDKATGETLIIFKSQNKGKEKELRPLKTTPNKGKIGFQVKIRHAKYYRREINIGLVFIVCDLSAKVIYWHPVQLDDTIDEVVLEAENKGQEFFTMYLDPWKQLNITNFEKFIDDIKRSTRIQAYRHQTLAKHPLLNDLAKEVVDKNAPLLDQVHQLFSELFKELQFYPISLLIKKYPITKNKGYISYYHSFSLETDNSELIDLLNSGTVSLDNSVIFTDDSYTKHVTDPESKFRSIYDRLFGNYIININSKGKSVHLSATYHESCNCAQCLYSRMEFSAALVKMKEPISEIHDKINIAYLHYQFGNYLDSAKMYLDILKQADQEGLCIVPIICAYNLAKLEGFVERNYWSNQEYLQVLGEIKKVDIKQVIEKHKSNENIQVLDWISEGKFYTWANENINQLVRQIRDHYQRQLTGGWVSNNHGAELINEYAQLDLFLSSNRVIFSRFSEFERLSDTFAEGLYASFGMNDEQLGKLKHLNEWIIIRLILHCTSKNLADTFRTYGSKQIPYIPIPGTTTFLELIENFFTKNFDLYDLYDSYAENQKIDFAKDTERIFDNLLIVIGHTSLSDSQIETIMSNFMVYTKKNTFTGFHSVSYLTTMIDLKSTQIQGKYFSDLLILTIDKPQYAEEAFVSLLINCMEKLNIVFKLNQQLTEKILDYYFPKSDIDAKMHQDVMFNYYKLMSPTNQRKFKNLLESKLKKKFNVHDYYLAAIYDILPIGTEFFEEFKAKAIPDRHKYTVRKIFGAGDNRSPYTDMFINLAFKNNINLSIGDYENFRKDTDYYSWLTDISGFNYDKFDIQWLKVYGTKYYYQEFKKHPMIKHHMVSFLKTNHDSTLERMFFTLFSE